MTQLATVGDALEDSTPDRGSATATETLVFATVALGMLMAALDQTIVSTALPTVVGDLGGSGHQSWVVTSYLLAETITVVVVGRLGDLFGRKAIFQTSVLLFVIGSALSGAAHSMDWLIVSRAVQGIGGGGITVTATALIAEVIPLERRGQYQGALGAVFGVTTVIGPLLGGFFTDHLSWRWAFYVNVPFAVIVIAAAAATIPSVRSDERPSIDWLGILFVALGAGGLTLATSWAGTTYAWLSATIIALFVASIVALGIFVVVELRAKQPILPMRLFRSRVFATSCVLALIVGFAMLGSITFLPTFLQYVNGVSATSSGLRMLPLVAGLLVTSVAAGTIVGKTGRYKVFPVVGTLIMAVGLYLISRLDEHTSTVVASLSMFVLGGGIGLCMQVITLIVQNTSSFDDLGVATSGVTFFRTLGSSFGAAVFGSLFANFLGSRIGPALVEAAGKVPATATSSPEALHKLPAAEIAPVVHAYAESLDHVFLWGVPVALVGFLLALTLKEVPLRGTAQAGASDLGGGFGMPTQETSEQRLEREIAAIFRSRGRAQIPQVIANSGTTLDTASIWGVLSIFRFSRVRGTARLGDIAHHHHLPAEVLEPTFDQLARDGLAGRDPAGVLTLTPGGQVEVDRLSHAVRAWLAQQLDGWEQGPDEDTIGAALGRISARILDDETGRRRKALAAAVEASATA